MVMSFFKRKGPTGLEHVEARALTMLADARHSFDLASLALLTGTLPDRVADDIRSTDHRINQAEQDLRTELVVHISVQGTADIGSVLGFMLLLKKIERIGDQAKNILDLAEGKVSLAGEANIDELHAERQSISEMFGTAGNLMIDPGSDEADRFVQAVKATTSLHQQKIDEFMHSDRPGNEVVPLAIYYRYLKRIAANLLGVVGVALEPLPHIDYLEEGTIDTDD